MKEGLGKGKEEEEEEEEQVLKEELVRKVIIIIIIIIIIKVIIIIEVWEEKSLHKTKQNTNRHTHTHTVLVINIVLTDTLLSNPKLSSLIFLANTRGLYSTLRCTTLRVCSSVLWVYLGGFFLAGIVLPPSSAIHFTGRCQLTPIRSEIPHVECPALWRAEMAVISSRDKT